jgi:hypothetical protein
MSAVKTQSGTAATTALVPPMVSIMLPMAARLTAPDRVDISGVTVIQPRTSLPGPSSMSRSRRLMAWRAGGKSASGERVAATRGEPTDGPVGPPRRERRPRYRRMVSIDTVSARSRSGSGVAPRPGPVGTRICAVPVPGSRGMKAVTSSR